MSSLPTAAQSSRAISPGASFSPWDQVLALSGVAQARMIRDGEISSAELVTAHLERIDQVNPSLNAAVDILRESALRDAALADQRRASGDPPSPIEGVPFSIKDSIEVARTVCTAGTLGFRHRSPSAHDAWLVARLRQAGAIPLVRTNLPDLLFAFETDNLIYGRTNNPYDLTRTCGGSSGGEAALIAACGSPFGLGSDAAGSVRVPAHFCGIASIKPTSGRLPRTGHLPPAGGWVEMLWQIGPMARHVEDLCAMMPILVGRDTVDPTVVEMPYSNPSQIALRDLRAAFFTDNGVVPPDSETAALVQRAAHGLASVLRSVDEARPPGIELSYELEMQLIGPDGGDGLREYLAAAGSRETHPLLEGWLNKLARYRTDVPGLARYWAGLQSFRAAMLAFLRDYDVVLSPVSAFPALLHGSSVDDAIFPGFSYTMTYNLTGWPAAVVRCGTTSSGLPIGIQIAAAPWREDRALAVATVLEQLFGGWRPFGAPAV